MCHEVRRWANRLPALEQASRSYAPRLYHETVFIVIDPHKAAGGWACFEQSWLRMFPYSLWR